MFRDYCIKNYRNRIKVYISLPLSSLPFGRDFFCSIKKIKIKKIKL